MIAVSEYNATANLSDSLLKMKSTSEAMMTTGVAPRWNQPRNLGGTTALTPSYSCGGISAGALMVSTVDGLLPKARPLNRWF